MTEPRWSKPLDGPERDWCGTNIDQGCDEGDQKGILDSTE